MLFYVLSLPEHEVTSSTMPLCLKINLFQLFAKGKEEFSLMLFDGGFLHLV